MRYFPHAKMRTDQKLFCLKVFLTIFILILWVFGSAVFGLLLWFRLDFWTNEYLELDDSLDRYLILIYISMVSGGLIMVSSLFGLTGQLCTVKWSIILYVISLCLSLSLTVAGSVYGFVYREELGCCGGDGPDDYSRYHDNSDPMSSSSLTAPPSCCKDYIRNQDRPSPCIINLLASKGQETEYNENIHRKGCKVALVQFLETYIVIVAGIIICFGAIQVVCIALSSLLLSMLSKLYVCQPEDIVYDMAHRLEKSPYPSRNDYR